MLGKNISWQWLLKTPRENCTKNCKIGNFEGSSIWFKEALERANQLQKHLLSFCLLPPFS